MPSQRFRRSRSSGPAKRANDLPLLKGEDQPDACERLLGQYYAKKMPQIPIWKTAALLNAYPTAREYA